MATIKEIIDAVDLRKPNAFTQEEKLGWIAELEGILGLNVFLLSPLEVRHLLQYRCPEDLETKALVDFPYDGIYEAWLEAKIDYANGEYDRYQNSMENYNARYGSFVRWFAGTYRPAQGYREEG